MAVDKELLTHQKPIKLEVEGRELTCKCCKDHSEAKMVVIRRSASSLFMGLPTLFETLGAKEILSHAQSESDGNITISVIYK